MTFDDVFEISWENADNWTSSTTNELNYYYTLFWCEKSIDGPNQCDVSKIINICIYTRWKKWGDHYDIRIQCFSTSILTKGFFLR